MRIGTGFDIKRRCISHAVAAMAVIAAYLPLSAFRHAFDPTTRSANIGFRVVCTAGLE